MVKAIVGANWGDEGKGKITDMFAAQSDVVVRFQGGANAGHTIINHYGKFALHCCPPARSTPISPTSSATAWPSISPLSSRRCRKSSTGGVPAPKLLVSDRAQIIMPYHVLFDQYEEERLSSHSFGSTKSGIAPFYSDKYAKVGFQVCELFVRRPFVKRLERVIVTQEHPAGTFVSQTPAGCG